MTLTEFYSWMKFYEEEPWGDFRADLRAGVVSSVIVRMMGAKGARPKPLDFMPMVKAQMERLKAERDDKTAELRAALLSAFKGKLRVVRARQGAHHG